MRHKLAGMIPMPSTNGQANGYRMYLNLNVLQKGGINTNYIYPWGNNFIVNYTYKADGWQGTLPDYNELKDVFKYSSPVGYFGKNALGLSDMTANVWEWFSNDKFSNDEFLITA